MFRIIDTFNLNRVVEEHETHSAAYDRMDELNEACQRDRYAVVEEHGRHVPRFIKTIEWDD